MKTFAVPTLAVAALATVAHAQSKAVAMSVPAIAGQSTRTGRLAPSTVLAVTLSLAPADRKGLEAFVDGVSDPRSPTYRQFLTPAQVGARFGAPASTVNAALAFLKAKGLTVTMVADSHFAILLKGRVDKLEAAFGTEIDTYHAGSRIDGRPQDFYSFSIVPKVPASFASSVVTITGLDDANPPLPRGSLLTPSQARKLYSASVLYDAGSHGEGVRVGISNFDGYRLSNLPLLYSAFGLAVPSGGVGSNVRKVIVGGTDGETVTEGGEGDLDFQAVLSMAPCANVVIYDGIGGGLIATLAQEAQDNFVDVVSESYGWGAGNDFYLAGHDQHLQLAAQGITYCCASGDSGTDVQGFPYPNMDPETLMVGGTEATVDSQGNRIQEPGWNGSGAGWITTNVSFNALPDYQKGDTVPTNIDKRLFPDVAIHATGSEFVFHGAVGGIAGTSVASPVFAGQLGLLIQALSAQDALEPSSGGRPRLGRFTDVLYGFDGDPTVFFDVVGGDGGMLPDGSEAVGKKGWDFLTGWGAPNLNGLFQTLLAASSVTLTDDADAADIYSTSAPRITYGTNPVGGAGDLATADGATYSVVSVGQAGVGQVAAVTIDFTLAGDPAKRKSVGVSATLSSARLTTDYVYVFNWTTNKYDLLKTTPATGTETAVDLADLSLSKYVNGDSVRILVRALKPLNQGQGSFRLLVDQAVAKEKVSRG